MLSEINGEELNEDDDTMVTYAHCPYCGARYELTDTPESEKRNYPYWQFGLVSVLPHKQLKP